MFQAVIIAAWGAAIAAGLTAAALFAALTITAQTIGAVLRAVLL